MWLNLSFQDVWVDAALSLEGVGTREQDRVGVASDLVVLGVGAESWAGVSGQGWVKQNLVTKICYE